MSKTKHYSFGPYQATINGPRRTIGGGRIDPALSISFIDGPGLFSFSDVHFSTAKTVPALKSRLDRFVIRSGYSLIESGES